MEVRSGVEHTYQLDLGDRRKNHVLKWRFIDGAGQGIAAFSATGVYEILKSDDSTGTGVYQVPITSTNTSIRGLQWYDETSDIYRTQAVRIVADTLSAVELIRKISEKRWKIIGTQQIFYDDDNVTPLITFDLKDANGDPTASSPFERMPVT